METYLRIAFWVRVALVPISIAILIGGATQHNPLLLVPGVFLLLSSLLFFVGTSLRRRSGGAPRKER